MRTPKLTTAKAATAATVAAFLRLFAQEPLPTLRPAAPPNLR